MLSVQARQELFRESYSVHCMNAKEVASGLLRQYGGTLEDHLSATLEPETKYKHLWEAVANTIEEYYDLEDQYRGNATPPSCVNAFFEDPQAVRDNPTTYPDILRHLHAFVNAFEGVIEPFGKGAKLPDSTQESNRLLYLSVASWVKSLPVNSLPRHRPQDWLRGDLTQATLRKTDYRIASVKEHYINRKEVFSLYQQRGFVERSFERYDARFHPLTLVIRQKVDDGSNLTNLVKGSPRWKMVLQKCQGDPEAFALSDLQTWNLPVFPSVLEFVRHCACPNLYPQQTPTRDALVTSYFFGRLVSLLNTDERQQAWQERSPDILLFSRDQDIAGWGEDFFKIVQGENYSGNVLAEMQEGLDGQLDTAEARQEERSLYTMKH